ncbi:flagellar biosynthesis anti-sigma factor FlgM [Persicimonas caeni]|jgi:flagellar biosynthesis anti-sigma factor FlgM|uniref:Negative regulator of flagellin synthesis n=1 Tax=Persicimonas caeni TaxID=2292766 RepID=A0A4Y6PSS3_PERCE|nr:flagellar biosynthesis anti-sigma factor FlgM [Persicimonas caeni]QDG51348.1 flagellar biosynthesis anti-sigma factor FlgM [Persicimonas caeni]QED32569.1 flagellar biosynthesis anti-sigma factor FlgM [Persicimonas caeni]
MKIINLNNTPSTRVNKAGGSEKAAEVQSETGEQNAANARDSVDVSASRHLNELTDIAMQSPVDDVAFEELKAAIRSGEYKPDLQGLADRMLGDGAAIEILGDS